MAEAREAPATPAYTIQEIVKLFEEKRIELVGRPDTKKKDAAASGGGAKGGAPAMRYWWNLKDEHGYPVRGPVTINVGNAPRMADEPGYQAPILLVKPEEWQDPNKGAAAPRPEGTYPTYGAFTALQDPEEIAAWARFHKLYTDAILDKKIITVPARALAGLNEEGRRSILCQKIAEVVKLPDDFGAAVDPGAGAGVGEPKRKNTCITQKLNMDPRYGQPYNGTKFFQVRMRTPPDGGAPKMQRMLLSLDPVESQKKADAMMHKGMRIASRVELGELKLHLEKYRTMLYTREVYFMPPVVHSTAAVSSICGVAVEDVGSFDDEDGACAGAAGAGSGCGADASADASDAAHDEALEDDMARLNAIHAALLRETDDGADDGADDGDGDEDGDEDGDDDGDGDDDADAHRAKRPRL
jgi:hypothetical protein